MKLVVILMLILFGSNSQADCQDEWLTYRSSELHLSASYSEGCYQGQLILGFSKPSEDGKGGSDSNFPSGSIPFDSECTTKEKDKEGETIEFSCRKEGVSPLAGATYRFKLVETTIECDGVVQPDWEHTFICISGCGPTTPKTLVVPYGEGCA
ncbi:MAG: hypothetical protein WAW12_15860 [Pseudomonas sp.]